jgi:P27 family predicted phage terminase small subunit
VSTRAALVPLDSTVRGRKAVPTELKLLRGNPGKRAIATDEPTPALVDETHEPPAWLDESAKAEWRRVAPILSRNGLLTEMDLDALTAYCHAWCVWKDANAKIKQFGMVIKSPNGYPIPSPYLPIANKAMLHMKGLMSEFGMTPSARTHVARAKDPAAPANPLDRFLRKR